MGKLFQVPAQVTGFTPKADRSYKVTFETRELTGDEVALLAGNFQGEGWLVYSPNELQASQIPTGEAEAGVKTPAQRLRGKVYVLWKQLGGTGDFENYWRAYIQKRIDELDIKLNGE